MAWSRRVVGCSIDITQTATLVASALDMALRNRDAQPGVVIHSDHRAEPRLSPWALNRPHSCFRPSAIDWAGGGPRRDCVRQRGADRVVPSGARGHQNLRTRRAAPDPETRSQLDHRDAPLSGRRLAPARQPRRRLLRARGLLLHRPDRQGKQFLSSVRDVLERAC